MSTRRSTFTTRKPFSSLPELSNEPSHIAGPFSFLNPTRAHFHHIDSPPYPSASSAAAKKHPHSVSAAWTSRDNRKGRHGLSLTQSAADSADFGTPPASSSLKVIARNVGRMFVVFPVWDVSYLVATIFTWGSIVWVINAFFAFLPDLQPKYDFPNEVLYGGGITAFIGATIFEIGSVLLMLEAINEHKEGDFGWAVEEALDGMKQGPDKENSDAESGGKKMQVKRAECSHHHANKKNFVGSGPAATSGAADDATAQPGRAWTWWPSAHDLRTHYLHELGFLACSSQMAGATIFWIAGFTALPGIYNHLSPGLVDGIYWTPQVIGGSGFVVSGTLFMLETQRAWYRPAFGVLGWWIGLFNLIGGVGFTLSPIFGYDLSTWSQYQAGCSTFWGSWAFLIGSAIQWYESLDKYPVQIRKN